MFITRLISGAVLTLMLIGLLIPGGYILLVGSGLIGLIGFHELYKALTSKMDKKGIDPFEILGLVFVVLHYAAITYFGLGMEVLMLLIAALLLMMGVYVLRFPKYKCENVFSAFLSLVYCPVLLSFIYLTRNLDKGIYIVWLIFVASWISDTGAYLVGRAIGKHKLAPVLSPKKSIEGAIGGVVSAALIGALYGFILQKTGAMNLPMQVVSFAIIGGCGSILSQLGDLGASGFKRERDVKDYGKLIPGHGGIMDRFDSVIVTSPIIYILAFYLLK